MFIKTRKKKMLADTVTPVNIYLKLRDVYAGTILLESSDYHGHENSLSYLCCDPIASFTLKKECAVLQYPGASVERVPLAGNNGFKELLASFIEYFEAEESSPPVCGLFGYMSFDAVRYVEDVKIDLREEGIPDAIYKLYRYVIVLNHFSNDLILCENYTDETDINGLAQLEHLIFSNRFPTYPFKLVGSEESVTSDAAFLASVQEAVKHCQRGDVFQLVLSRRFIQGFQGDEFNVYRCLRSINPSPYLFYFDYGSFKLFGSSPEAQLQIANGEASIFPIAGTVRRTGDDREDAVLAEQLTRDEKENAEHVMLVDLARNDLSRVARGVKVEVFREVQYYSHVIHLVSKVTGRLEKASSLQLALSTFPAGTLSGAPKPMAVTLINRYEKINRGFYGGAIGFIGFHGEYNHAIMIRTFLSRNQQLISQAGAGIVARSRPEGELQEVNNKLEALRRAMKMAITV